MSEQEFHDFGLGDLILPSRIAKVDTMLAQFEEEYLQGVVCPETITIKLTCISCPEQYEVYSDGDEIGYLRFRYGLWEVWYTVIDRTLLYKAMWEGEPYKSEFETQEKRAEELNRAIKWLVGYHLTEKAKPKYD